MPELTCAVAKFGSAGDGGTACADLLACARRHGAGDFSEIAALATQPTFGRATMEAQVQAAAREGFDWLLLIDEEETIAADILAKATPALRVYDALWGGAGISQQGTCPVRVEQVTRLAADDLAGFFHAALAWWIGRSHFVRPALALEALSNAAGEKWWAEYLLHIWLSGRAMKSAQALTLFAQAVAPMPRQDRERLVEYLDERPVFMPVSHGAATVRLPYTGLNRNVEREHMRGAFFERMELAFLADRLPKGMRMIDAGANTGNHTVFFAAVMEAAVVVPIEPGPRACRALRASLRENGLSNVDDRLLGWGIGAHASEMAAVSDERAGLGGTRLVTDLGGAIPVAPLDILWHEPVEFIKVDVEGMEMAVLSGAAGLIAEHRPFLLVEVLDERTSEFVSWADASGYRIERLFPDKMHCNYFLAPQESRQ